MSKTGIILIGVFATAALVYQILERVPTDALNIALGVACGIGASIPVSLGLLIALTRQRQQDDWQIEWQGASTERLPQRSPPQRYAPQQIQEAAQPQPQIIVIAPPQGQFAPGQFPQGFPIPAQWLNQQAYAPMHENPNTVDAREWRIIGEDS